MTTVGTQSNPLRVAIIGSGPSGFYAAEHLQKQKGLVVEIDMFDRLPTPFGLVRGGVAPDHQKIKSVTKVYDRIASKPNFHFFGNVSFGKDLSYSDLHKHYHAMIYAVGAQTDRNLGIPGEELSGSHAATEFVAWYNGHPDFRKRKFDLTQESVAIVGVGNVAMDVARILARSRAELEATDIADYALEALANSSVKNIYVLGRRGPAQAAFTTPEIKELGEMEIADVVIDPADMELDPLSHEYLVSGHADQKDVRNVEIMREYAQRPPSGKPKRIYMRFLVSPVELLGDTHVESIRVVKNELYRMESGDLRPRPTQEYEEIPVGLVFRSVGYRGVKLPDVPFYEKWGIIPNDKGRVLTDLKGERVIGNYVAGWIKRGPSGIIGTNRPDSVETIEALLEDMRAGLIYQPAEPRAESLRQMLIARGVRFVTFGDWQLLDTLEQQRGQALSRPRVKFSTVEEMLEALEQARAGVQQPGD